MRVVTCNGAEGADDLAPDADGPHVAVADGGHGDDRPPERVRNRLEV